MNPSELFIQNAGDLGAAGLAAFLAVGQSSAFATASTVLRGLSVMVSLVLLTLIIILVLRSNLLEEVKEKHYEWYRPAKIEKKTAKVTEFWQNIVGKFEHSLNPLDWRMAVIAADRLLFFVLDELKYTGDTLGEKLQYVTPAEIRNLGEVIPAHKEASSLQENPSLIFSYEKAKEMIDAYGFALKDLGVLVG